MTYDINRITGNKPAQEATAYDILKEREISGIVKTVEDFKTVSLIPLHLRVSAIGDDGVYLKSSDGTKMSGYVLGGSRQYFACIEDYWRVQCVDVTKQEKLCHALDWSYTYWIKNAYGKVDGAPNVITEKEEILDLDVPAEVYQGFSITTSPEHTTEEMDNCLGMLLMFNVLRKLYPQELTRRVRAIFASKTKEFKTQIEAEFQKREDFNLWIPGYTFAQMHAVRAFQALYESSFSPAADVIKTMAIYVRYYGLPSVVLIQEISQIPSAVESAPEEIQRELKHFTDLRARITPRDFSLLRSTSLYPDMIRCVKSLFKCCNAAAWFILALRGAKIPTKFAGYAKNRGKGGAKIATKSKANLLDTENIAYLSDRIKDWVRSVIIKEHKLVTRMPVAVDASIDKLVTRMPVAVDASIDEKLYGEDDSRNVGVTSDAVRNARVAEAERRFEDKRRNMVLSEEEMMQAWIAYKNMVLSPEEEMQARIDYEAYKNMVLSPEEEMHAQEMIKAFKDEYP